MVPNFDRSDIAPAVVGLVIGETMGDLLTGSLSANGYLSFAAAMIYVGLLVRDAFRAFRRPL